ncbi:reverse transcriptase domain-containing protein [Tanacetum coccineum]
MPFGLKNARATYQRLVDTIFEGKIGRNLEAYVDDMIIKSKTELEMIKDVKNMPLPSNLKQMQRLSGKLAVLNRLLSKAVESALPCLDTLKKCTNKKDFHWNTEADEAFQAIKKLIAKLPTLTAPKKEEELMVYLSATNEVVSAVLLVERDRRQIPIHQVITDKPISQILDNREAMRRLAKWGVELKAYNIKYAPRGAIKGQVLADFLADTMTKDNPTQEKTNRPDNTLEEGESREEQETTIIKAPENLKAEVDVWKLYTDGASNEHGSGAGLILIDPEGAEYSYALRFEIGSKSSRRVVRSKRRKEEIKGKGPRDNLKLQQLLNKSASGQVSDKGNTHGVMRNAWQTKEDSLYGYKCRILLAKGARGSSWVQCLEALKRFELEVQLARCRYWRVMSNTNPKHLLSERASLFLDMLSCNKYLERQLNGIDSERIMSLISQEISGRAVDLEEIQEKEDTTSSEITSNIPQEVEGFELPQEEVILIRRSKRIHRAPNRLCLNVEVEEHSLVDLNEPTSYKVAMLDLESNKWIDSMNAEIQSMMNNMVWVLADLPPGCKTVGSRLYHLEQWNWNWSKEDTGVRNMTYMRDMLMGISQVDLNAVDGHYVLRMAKDGIFFVREYC